jgi:integrase
MRAEGRRPADIRPPTVTEGGVGGLPLRASPVPKPPSISAARSSWSVRASVGDGCTFHVLRHTHAALLIAQGEHPKVIQERLGHASIKTTLDTYGHLFDGLDEAAAERLDASWRDPRVDALWTQRGRDVIELPSR